MDITLLSHGMRYVGISELSGKKNHPLISWWISLCGFDLDAADEIPWCSAFVNGMAWDLRLARSSSLAARSWLEVGRIIGLNEASPGWDIVVLKRGLDPQPGPDIIKAPGHVGIYAGTGLSPNVGVSSVSVLGGNQSNRVSVASFPLARILGIRRLL